MYELGKILLMNQEDLAQYIINVAEKKGLPIIKNDEAFIGLNIQNNKPCLVSHLDKVGKIPTLDQIIFDTPLIKAANTPIGGDDRCGVFIILELIRLDFTNYSFLLCFDEEKGCLGSSQVDIDFEPTCFIGLDRRGWNDCATYGYDNEKLLAVFKEQGFEPIEGSITDVAILAPRYGVACVNLSVGFFNEHTKDEYINIHAVYNTLAILTKGNVQKALEQKFPIEYLYDLSAYEDFFDYCEICNQYKPLAPYRDLYICDDCFNQLMTEKSLTKDKN